MQHGKLHFLLFFNNSLRLINQSFKTEKLDKKNYIFIIINLNYFNKEVTMTVFIKFKNKKNGTVHQVEIVPEEKKFLYFFATLDFFFRLENITLESVPEEFKKVISSAHSRYIEDDMLRMSALILVALNETASQVDLDGKCPLCHKPLEETENLKLKASDFGIRWKK